MKTRAQDGWRYVPDDWEARERLSYLSSSSLLGLEFSWAIEKVPHSTSALVRAEARVQIPFRREQRLSWKTRFSAEAQGPIGFEFLEETNEVTGSKRMWRAEGDRILLLENKVETPIAPPSTRTVFNAFQIPAFFRSMAPPFSTDPLILIISKRVQVLRATGDGRVGSFNKLKMETANLSGNLDNVNWSESKSGVLVLDAQFGVVREVRIHVPLLGQVSAKLDKHEIFDS
ncbi:MAG: hypothetical protein NDI61_04840 [Bdellovibrionaceae bacterium]|nr:hypothetical protein [Pseudobdellovibrionaceae bacterium]